MADDVKKAVMQEQKAKAQTEAAVEKAAPTGKDVPAATREPVEGTNTAHNPDAPTPKTKNSPAQTEPALRTRGGEGGTVPHAHVSSPTGLVPARSAADLVKYAEKLDETVHGTSVEDDQDEIEEDVLMSMSKPEIRAAATDRGLVIGEGGKRTLVRNFLSEQRKGAAERKSNRRKK
jgi:plasmid stability protein